MAKKIVSGRKTITSSGSKVSFSQKSGNKLGKTYTYKPTKVNTYKPTKVNTNKLTKSNTYKTNSKGGVFTQAQISKVKSMIKKKTGGYGVDLGGIAAKVKSNPSYTKSLAKRIKKKKR